MKKEDFKKSKTCDCRYCEDSGKIRSLVKKYKMTEQEEDFLLDINFQIVENETRFSNWKANTEEKIDNLLKLAKK